MLHMLKTYTEHYTAREEGATAVEYGIMVALIAVVIIVIVGTLGEQLRDVFQFTSEELGDIPTSG